MTAPSGNSLARLLNSRRLRNSAAIALMAGMLAACGTAKGPPQPCPELILPSQTSYMTVFAGDNDLSNIAYEAKIMTTPETCWYSNADVEPKSIRSAFKVQVQVTRGPKFQGDKVTLKYAIGITGPGGHPLENGKQTFDVDVDFSKGEVTNIAIDDITRVVIFPKENENGDFYRILVGLDLTKDQLDYNKRNPRQ